MGKRSMVNASDGKSEHETAQTSKDQVNLFWQDEVMRSRKRSRLWRARAATTVDTYRGITDDDFEFFNILWSNTETLKGAVYSHTPKPEVTRRFLEVDLEGNAMALVMERCLSYSQSTPGHDFDTAVETARDDYLLAGRGTIRVCYEAEFEDEEIQAPDVDAEGNEVMATTVSEKKVWEEVFAKHIPWKDFDHSFGEQWEDVWWVGFASDMTRDDLTEKFGDEKGKEIPLNGEMKYEDWDNWASGDIEGSLSAGFYDWYDREDYARVWEIWDKRERKVIFISEGNPDIIKEDEDPYNLEEFFPCPMPIYSVKTSDSLVPIPEYTQYQYQAEELNIITRRLTRLTDALKARGVCDADIHSLTRLFDGEDNAIIPDEDYGKLAAQGGVDGAVSWAPIAVISDVIAKLSVRRQEILGEIYELTGISDILRGQSDPRETATAIKTKGRFGTLRIQQRQKAIQRFSRDALRLMGELIAGLFDAETLVLMSGTEKRPEIMQGMEAMVAKFRNDEMRDYTISIESDSTIAINEAEQKQDVTEFFGATASLLQHLMPAVQQGIIPMPVAKTMLLYAAQRFDAGRDLTDALNQMGQKPGKQQEDPAQKQQQQAQQMKMEMEKQKLALQQAELEFKMQKLQVDVAMEMEKLKLAYQQMGMDWEGKKLTEQVKLATSKMDVEAAKANRGAN